MKAIVVCLFLTVALGNAAPSDVYAADLPAQKALAVDSAPVSPSSSLVSTPVEKTPVKTAAVQGEKIEPVAGVAPEVAPIATPVDVDKVKSESQDKRDDHVEPVVEAAQPSESFVQDLTANTPVKKVPVFVPVEYAAAYHPDNFFNPSPVTSGLSGYVAAPSTAAYPYRTVVHPLYQMVSPEVPILTLYPGDSDESYRRQGVSCADPTLRYVHGAGPMIFTGPQAASPYAANQYAAASLAQGANNPNPYGSHAPYYRLSYIPEAASYVTPAVDYSRSILTSPSTHVYPISSISLIPPPLSRLNHIPSSVSPAYKYPDSINANRYVHQTSPLASLGIYTANGRREYADEPDRHIKIQL